MTREAKNAVQSIAGVQRISSVFVDCSRKVSTRNEIFKFEGAHV